MSGPIRIDSAEDPLIAAYLNIRDREVVGRKGSFIAEGSVVLRKLLASRSYAPQSALILENRVPGLADAMDLMHRRGIPVFIANRRIIDAIAGFPLHRGVLAAGATIKPNSVEDIIEHLPSRATIVVCVGISNHDNIGAIFRNATGLGADAVLYDATSCDPLYRKAIRVSAGSVFDIAHARFDGVAQLRQRLSEAGFHQLALTPAGVTEISDQVPAARCALYLGAEGPGLPVSLIQALQGVRIGMEEGFDSLNVAAASAIALHWLRTNRLRG